LPSCGETQPGFQLIVWWTGHLTDIESFPVQSERYPQLSAKGAFCPSCVYTREDLTDVVDYGALRGVRVLPEFDVPGHAGWAFGHPEITINGGPCSKWQPLDPTLDATYALLKEFLSEMAEIFTDPYLLRSNIYLDPPVNFPITFDGAGTCIWAATRRTSSTASWGTRRRRRGWRRTT